jgi:arylsulfatase A-like enzyme
VFKGTGAAFLAGVTFEALVLLVRLIRTDQGVLLRSERLARLLEVGAVAGAIGLLAGLATLWWNRRGGGEEVSAAGAAWVAGFLGCLTMTVGFLVNPPAPETIQFSTDPITQRWAMLLAGVVLAVIGVFAVYRWRGALRRTLGSGRAGPLAVVPAVVAVVSAMVPTPTATAGDLPDIYLLTVDALRADHLGCYGYPSPTSPAIDRLCRGSIVYERAMTPVPETIAAYSSLFTGLSPEQHGVYNNFFKAPDELRTLAELLRERGYFTGAILEGSLPGTFANLDQGFDLVVQRGIVARSPVYSLSDAVRSVVAAALAAWSDFTGLDATPTTGAAGRWIHAVSPDQPVFLHIYWPFPHTEYDPPVRYLREVPSPDVEPHLRDEVHRYDAEIRYTDSHVARVLDAIETQRGLEHSWVVFTSDHGEELGRPTPDLAEPYFFGHTRFLYDTSLRVPLIVHPPAARSLVPGRSPSLVSLLSIAPTLLAAAGAPPSPHMGPPLPLAGGEASGSEVYAVMRKAEPDAGDERIYMVSVRDEQWRLVETRVPVYALELLHYGSAGETPAPAGDHAEVVDRLLGLLHRRFPPGEAELEDWSQALTEKEQELLRSLGYIK